VGRDELTYLSRADVSALLPPPLELVGDIEVMFEHKACGQAEMPPKLGVHFDDAAFIHAMPASVREMDAVGVKWVAAFPANAQQGLPQISALIILNDPATGIPYAILDGAEITATRTAAVSTLSARYLARAGVESLGVLGCGVQGRSHVRAFREEFGLRRIVAYDVSIEALQRFTAEMAEECDIEIVPASTARDAVVDCDLVVTAGPITSPPHGTIRKDWLGPGACAISIDYGSYWDAEALEQMDVLCTDDVRQFVSHRENGHLMGMPDIELDLADLVHARETRTGDPEKRAFACNLGIALADVAVAKRIVMRAIEDGVGIRLPR